MNIYLYIYIYIYIYINNDNIFNQMFINQIIFYLELLNYLKMNKKNILYLL